MGQQEQAQAFETLIIAGMMDAAIERKLTQLKAVITPPNHTRPIQVRIIIVPESMDIEQPKPFEMPVAQDAVADHE